ncbi:MAG: hypothetical protein EXR71_11135 [Myxococcales bacterium]|nr:hypothetical protein [Myxococcales bacterium]
MTRRWWIVAVFALGVALWHAFGDGPFRLRYPVVGASPDAHGTFWMYDWVREEVMAGRFPITTTRMFYPDGMDFLVLNGVNVVDALISVPLQVWFGTGRGELYTCVLIVLGNALAFFPLARRLAPARPDVSILATFWWTVNPYVLAEMGAGRPTQAMLWFYPLAAMAILRFDGWKDAALLGVAMGAQGLIYWYSPVFFAIVFAPVAIARVLQEPRAVVRFGAAVLVSVLIVAPLAWPIAEASMRGEIPGLGLDIESTGMWVQSQERTRRLFAQLGMISTLVVVLGALVRWRLAPALALGVLLGLAFSSGARLNSFGIPIENTPYVWLFEHSSLLSRLNFPARVLGAVYCVAVIAVVPVLVANRIRMIPWVFFALLILEGRANRLGPGCVLAVPPMPASAIVTLNPGPILTTPMGAPDISMVQQVFHRQPLVSGMGDHVETVRPSGYDDWLVNPYFAELVQADNLMAPWTRKHEEEVRKVVRWVWFDRALLARGTESPLTETIESRLHIALGEPYYTDSYTAIWDLTRKGETATEVEVAAAAAAETVLEQERETCTAGQLRGVLWPFGEGKSSIAAAAKAEEAAKAAKDAAAAGAASEAR